MNKQKTNKQKTKVTYILSKPFIKGYWYDVEEYEFLAEARKQYDKEMVAAIIEKKTKRSTIFRKGKNDLL